MAGILSFKSISYSQNLVLAKVFRAYFSSVEYSNLQYRSFGFSKVTPFGVWVGPEKDRDVCFCGGWTLRLLSPDSSGQLDIFWHDGDSPGVDGTQVGIIE